MKKPIKLMFAEKDEIFSTINLPRAAFLCATGRGKRHRRGFAAPISILVGKLPAQQRYRLGGFSFHFHISPQSFPAAFVGASSLIVDPRTSRLITIMMMNTDDNTIFLTFFHRDETRFFINKNRESTMRTRSR
jgi:hypothetical protein